MAEGQVAMVVEASANLFVAVVAVTPMAVEETEAKSLLTETSQSTVHKLCQKILRQIIRGNPSSVLTRNGRSN
jgi:hypothetical protein